LQYYFVSRYADTAALVLLLYDTSLIINDEIEFIWRSEKHAPHYLYIMNRYIGGVITAVMVTLSLNPVASENFCRARIYLELYAGLVAILLTHAVLIYRACAVYGWRTAVVVTLAIGWLAGIVTSLAIGVPVLLRTPYSLMPLPPPFVVCEAGVSAVPGLSWVFWIIPISMDILLLALVIFRTRSIGLPQSHMFHILSRDSMMVYVCHFALQLTVLFIWRFAPIGLAPEPLRLLMVLGIVLTSRMLLNLWSYARHDETDFKSYSRRPLTVEP